jgi:hypothetical protein
MPNRKHEKCRAPTTAAIVSGLNKKDNQKILVFDLGVRHFNDGSWGFQSNKHFLKCSRLPAIPISVVKFSTIEWWNKKKRRRVIEKRVAKRALSTLHQTRIEIRGFFSMAIIYRPFTRPRFDVLNIWTCSGRR